MSKGNDIQKSYEGKKAAGTSARDSNKDAKPVKVPKGRKGIC